jgi:thymidylate synthase (FAD)
MKIVEQSAEIISKIDENVLELLELAGRTCYKSEAKITEDSAEKFVGMLKRNGHWASLEHYSVTVRFITDRGLTHEIVRHRLGSYSQESTRYVNYAGDDIAFIKPSGLDPGEEVIWETACKDAEIAYKYLLAIGSTPQRARSVLPTCVKTELVMTANLREWYHVFKLRTAPAAHPDIRKLMYPLLAEFNERIPVLYSDLLEEEEEK